MILGFNLFSGSFVCLAGGNAFLLNYRKKKKFSHWPPINLDRLRSSLPGIDVLTTLKMTDRLNDCQHTPKNPRNGPPDSGNTNVPFRSWEFCFALSDHFKLGTGLING